MDENLLLRDGSTNLTDDETLDTTKIGPMVSPMYLHVAVPYVRSGDSLDVEAEFCDTSEPTTQISNMNMKQIVAAGSYCEPFFTHHDYIQVKLGLTTGTSEALSMGAVKVWIDDTASRDELYTSSEQNEEQARSEKKDLYL